MQAALSFKYPAVPAYDGNLPFLILERADYLNNHYSF